ncbi:MAG: hypothetical protein U0271_12510 [Polyangiaceae bacterium]
MAPKWKSPDSAALFVLALALCACGDKSNANATTNAASGSSPSTAAAALPIDDGSCKDNACSVSVNPVNNSVVGRAPKGASVRLGGQTLTPDGEGKISADVDWRAALLGSPLEHWTSPKAGSPGPTRFGLEVIDGSKRYSGDVRVSKEAFVIKAIETFADLAKGPIAANPEGTGKALLWIPSKDMRQSATPVLLGEAKTLGDVELVAVTTDLPPIKKSCGLYRNTSTGETGQIGTNTYPVEVKTYERRTGKVRDTKQLTPKAQECPQSMAGGGFPDLGSTMNSIDVVEYVKTLAGK